MATLKSATNPPSREPLLADVALDVQAMVQQRHNPLQGYKPSQAEAVGTQVLDELRAVQTVVAAKATPRRLQPSAAGCSKRRRPPPTRPRRAGSWGSGQSR